MTSSAQQTRPMTVGELSQRTGVPIKNLRQYTDWGLISTMGRSTTNNYRLFDADALRCVHLIGQLRGLGLTVAEIRDLTGSDRPGTGEPIGPRLAQLLRHSRARLTARIAELQQTMARIDEFEATHQPDLVAHLAGCWMGNPRCLTKG
jgi:DNA-binding transcriptional MerR regulator